MPIRYERGARRLAERSPFAITLFQLLWSTVRRLIPGGSFN